ncbi:hypothetical protein GCK72_020870 [Caenorhabditis remanei]|uniref:CUB-like domain-containing protein n=1 Tax=Caenorhabditis remanei TaxID=31234 RepID=A0A6A5GGN0_CAERE|nr:hypothetical protein GCK72_020870 [Caenorhabditis remanei]KAF1754310.1 hypothetical protein GCK72_020870 [Caenorhabditis remanei]
MLRQLLILSCLLLLSVASQGYNCSGKTVVNPPKDLSEPYYFPNDWNESMPPAKYNQSQKCKWHIIVPNGMYATAIFYLDAKGTGGFMFAYSNERGTWIYDDDFFPYISTFPYFELLMSVDNDPGAFSFKVTWSNYPNACQRNITLDASTPVPLIPDTCFTTYTAPNNVALIGFSTKEDSDDQLRQSAVFEGDSYNGSYLGNLWDMRGGQIVSNSTQLTVYTFGLSEIYDYVLYMGVDAKAVGDGQTITGTRCRPGDGCEIPVRTGYTVATVSEDADYLIIPRWYSDKGTLKIYEGKLSEDNLLTTVNQSDYNYKFPMAVKNNVKFYTFQNGSVNIPLTNEPPLSYYKVAPGRIVNIHSFYYRQLSSQQYTNETYTTTSTDVKVYFNLDVKSFDVIGPTYLDISVFRDDQEVFQQRYKETNRPPTTTLRVLGDKITVTYDTLGYNTTGFEINMFCTEDDQTTTTTSTTSTSTTTVVTTTTVPTTTQSTTPTTKPTTTTTPKAIPTTTSTTMKTTTTKFSATNKCSSIFLLLFLVMLW